MIGGNKAVGLRLLRLQIGHQRGQQALFALPCAYALARSRSRAKPWLEALVMLPLVMVANYGLMAWMPVFALVRVTMIAENGMNYSLHGTSCHSLFLPLTREQKYVGKTTIDTFFWRFGDLLHALTIFVAAQWLQVEIGRIMLFNLGLALVGLAVSLLIGREHARAADARAGKRTSKPVRPLRHAVARAAGRRG